MNQEQVKEKSNFQREAGQVVEVKIEDMSREGQGIGRAGGLVIFVPGAVAGDVVRAELTKVKKNYAFSRLLEILELSPWRGQSSIESICASFAKCCGGCPYGGLVYEAQLWIKERQVRQVLQRIAGVDDPLVRPIVGMSAEDNEGFGPYRYRNKAQFPVSTGGIITRKGGIVENLGDPMVGFYRAKSHEVVDCGDCYLQSMAAMAAADALRAFMEEDHITAWDPKWGKGLIRHLIVKTAFATREVMVILVINGKGIPNGQKLVEMLDEAIYETGYSLESVVLSMKKGGGPACPGGVIKANGAAGNRGGAKGNRASRGGGKKAKKNGRGQMSLSSVSSGAGRTSLPAALGGEVMGDENIVLAGKPVIRDMVGGLAFEISPASFYQVNPVQMQRLYEKVRAYCGFAGSEGEKENLVGEERALGEKRESLESKREGFSGRGGNLRDEREALAKEKWYLESTKENLENEKTEKSAGSGGSGVDAEGRRCEAGVYDSGSGSDAAGRYEFDAGGGRCTLNAASGRSVLNEDGGRCEMDVCGGRKPVILDLYCGVGSIGLFCADEAEMVIGIERVKEAVVDANRNAVINGIVNARYLCGKAEDILPTYAGYGKGKRAGEAAGGADGEAPTEETLLKAGGDAIRNLAGKMSVAGSDGQTGKAVAGGQRIDAELAEFVQRADIAILDPPRAGCKPELLEAVAGTGVDRIVYVSCDPATLARDIKLLGGMGYEFVEATPVDMFPGTGSVEVVSLLQKVK